MILKSSGFFVCHSPQLLCSPWYCWPLLLLLLYSYFFSETSFLPFCEWVWKSLSRIWLFAIPWTIQSRFCMARILQARILEWVAFPFSRGSSQPRDRTQVSRIAGRFFTSWATKEDKNTGVGSLSLLQLIFPIQELNWGLLHCRWILYQLSYQGSLPSDYFLLAPFPVLPPKCCLYPSFFFPARPPSLWQFSPHLRLQLAPRIYILRYSFSPLLLSLSQRPPPYLHSYSGQNLYSHLSSRSSASPRLITHWFYFCTLSPICFSSPLFCMLIIPNLKRWLLSLRSIVVASTWCSLPSFSLLSSTSYALPPDGLCKR